MGWRDDPIATAPAAKAAWENDPVVDEQLAAPAAEEQPGLAQRALTGAVGVAKSIFPPSSSPAGTILNLITGGGYGEVAPQYGGLSQPPMRTVTRVPGESDRDYLLRSVKAHFDDPENASRGMSVALSAGIPGTPKIKEAPIGAAGESSAGAASVGLVRKLIDDVKGTESEAAPTGKPNITRRAVEAVAVTPTKSAEMLQAEGVPLTVGQLNPRSAIGQIEEASTSMRHVGPSIKAQRDAAVSGWQNVLLKKVLPPGMDAVPAGESVGEKLAAIYDGFKPAYASVKGQQIKPGITVAFDRAAKDLNVIADDATRGAVSKFLENQLTIPKVNEAGLAPVEEVLAVRSNVRDAIRAADKANKPDVAALLRNAEHSITQSVEMQIAPELAAKLKAIDAQYRGYKVMERAVAAAGDSPSGFMPSHVTRSIRQSMNDGEFARGGGGDLRALSKAGRVVFESVTPPTGARVLTVGPLGEYGTGPLAYYLNRPAGSMSLPPVSTAAPGLVNVSSSVPGLSMVPAEAAAAGTARPASSTPAPGTSAGATGAGAADPQAQPSPPAVTGGDQDPAEHFKQWMTDRGYREGK